MKVINDPIHGYIRMDELALNLLDTSRMQRLRRIRQLGFSYLVYPGANHTRFEHSLGTYHLAIVLAETLELSSDDRGTIRAAALLHDVGHGPYSHVTEDVIKKYGRKSHEDVEHIICKGEISEVLKNHSIDPNVVLAHIKGETTLGSVLHGDLDVDRMDYLIRDAYYTGVAYGMVDYMRLINEMQLIGSKLVVNSGGLHAVESLLVSRFLMQPTVYYHHVSRISRSMFTHALEHMLENRDLSVERLRDMDDRELDVCMHDCKGYPNEIVSRLNERRLFKRALYVGTASIDVKATLSHADNEQRLEREIADKAGVDPKYVLVDIPRALEMEEMRTSILVDGEVHDLDKVSQLVNILERAGWDAWRIGVYTPKEYVDPVGDAARKILNVRKALRQDVLI